MIPPEPGLANAWRTWRTLLAKFHTTPPTEVHILEIGAYEGDATSWFLRNLCAHPLSTVTAIDTWEGSPEYQGAPFDRVERKFEENTSATGREGQVVKLKMRSYKGLQFLQSKPNHFDVIFVDASHEAADVLSDSVMSFPLLKIGGVMIFDDYIWDKLVQEHYRPKVAIDGFVASMRPYLTILKKGRQLFVEKTEPRDAPVVLEQTNTKIKHFYDAFSKNIVQVLEHKKRSVAALRNLLMNVKVQFAQKGSTPATSSSALPHSAPSRVEKTTLEDSWTLGKPPSDYSNPSVCITQNAYSTEPPLVRQLYNDIYTTHMKSNHVIDVLQQLGVKPWNRTMFTRHMQLLSTYFTHHTSATSGITGSGITAMSFRHARDFSGNFYRPNVRNNFMTPFTRMGVHYTKYYDISCTTDLTTFGVENLSTHAELGHRENHYKCTPLNVWSLANWVAISTQLSGSIDVICTNCAIPSHQILSAHQVPTTVTDQEKEELVRHQRDVHATLVCIFALLTQRKGGCASITLLERTLESAVLQEVVSLMSAMYDSVTCSYSNFDSDPHKIELRCYNFCDKAFTADVRSHLRGQLLSLQMHMTPHHHTADGGTANPQHGNLAPTRRAVTTTSTIGVPVHEPSRILLKNFNMFTRERAKTMHTYNMFVTNLTQRLSLLDTPEVYRLLSSYQTRLLIKWCEQNMHRKQALKSHMSSKSINGKSARTHRHMGNAKHMAKRYSGKRIRNSKPSQHRQPHKTPSRSTSTGTRKRPTYRAR
jgi:predicted O-methyltransferase YrrM